MSVFAVNQKIAVNRKDNRIFDLFTHSDQTRIGKVHWHVIILSRSLKTPFEFNNFEQRLACLWNISAQIVCNGFGDQYRPTIGR